jgi:hypothetical protein
LRSPNHHGSHQKLLTQVDEPSAGRSEVDAIIVPTARPAAYLKPAMELAARLNCPLITLHSRYSSIVAARRLARNKSVDLIAVDMKRVPRDLLPEFGTTTALADTVFERRTDTSSKRNLGLLLARALDWKHVVFLDDDICIPHPEHLTDAVRLLHTFDGVGLTVTGYPDNSVVCHAHRETGGFQETFIGGGALAVNPKTYDSFFPDVYNEDWFFLLGEDTRLRPTARTSGIAIQRPYDPFANDHRARAEEFGDTLAEGVFWLLDQGKRVQDADQDFWEDFLHKRRRLITEILGRVDDADLDPAGRARMRSSLLAARGRSALIEPGLCVRYLRSWVLDRGLWAIHLDKHSGIFANRERPTAEAMLAELSLNSPSRQLLDQHVTGLGDFNQSAIELPVATIAFDTSMTPMAIPKSLVKPRRVKVGQLNRKRGLGESALEQKPFRELYESGAHALVAVREAEHLQMSD